MRVIDRVLDVTSTLEGERIGMTINEDALAKIMSILTDLYSDPQMAVIREYSTNAYDAHIEAGVIRPIEVTLPSALAPQFVVRDYGFGLDIDDIRDIYSQYGASTKTDSDDVVGMLGLGCKSALTYTDQFTLSSVKNGICTTVSVSRDADGAGSMTVVEETPTDEPSGTTVIVPAKVGNEFAIKAEEFFRFWEEGAVLVNGVAPKRIGSDSGLWIADDLLLTNEVDQSYVVMGNVAYPMPEQGLRAWNEWPVVAYVKIGAVQFTPSREQLMDTKLTETTLAEIRQRVKIEKVPAYERMINEQPTRADALKLALTSARIGIKGTLHYKGEEIPTILGAPKDTRFWIADRVKRWRRKGYDWNRTIVAEMWPKTIWVTGYDGADFSAHKLKKLHAWAEQKGLSNYEYFVMLDRIPKEVRPWIDKSRVYNWEEPAAIKIKVERNAKTGMGRISGSYKGYVDGVWTNEIVAQDIDTSKPVFFYPARDLDRFWRQILDKNHQNGSTLVLLGANRVNKFKRDFPAAKNAWDHIREIAATWQNNLNHHDLLALSLYVSGDRDAYRRFDADRVDDPDLRDAIRISKSNIDKLIEDWKLYSRFITFAKSDWQDPLAKYLLLTNMSIYGKLNGKFADQMYLYINAAYAASKEDECSTAS